MSNLTIPPRPKQWSDDIKRIVIEKIINDVAKWVEETPDEIRDDLVSCFECDGYDFAKALDDRRGWYANAELVEILDGAGAHIHSAIEGAERKWVSENNVIVPFEVGDLVMLRGVNARVVDVRSDTAKIVAQPTVSDGHQYGDKGGWVHPFEDARPAESGATA